MTFYQICHLILHEIDRFGCFMLKSGFFFFKKLGTLLQVNCSQCIGTVLSTAALRRPRIWILLKSLQFLGLICC